MSKDIRLPEWELFFKVDEDVAVFNNIVSVIFVNYQMAFSKKNGRYKNCIYTVQLQINVVKYGFLLEPPVQLDQPIDKNNILVNNYHEHLDDFLKHLSSPIFFHSSLWYRYAQVYHQWLWRGEIAERVSLRLKIGKN